jgi:hypothetical protein
MVQLLPLLEAVRDHPLPSTLASRRKRFTTRNFRNHGRAMLSRTPEFRTTSVSSSASPRCIEGRPPASVIVLSQLEIVALAVHPYRYSSDACPRIQPCAKCPQGAVVGGHRAPGEANSRAQELAAWVEHGLLDDLVRSPQHRRRDREAERLRGLEVNDQLELGGLLDGQKQRVWSPSESCRP